MHLLHVMCIYRIYFLSHLRFYISPSCPSVGIPVMILYSEITLWTLVSCILHSSFPSLIRSLDSPIPLFCLPSLRICVPQLFHHSPIPLPLSCLFNPLLFCFHPSPNVSSVFRPASRRLRICSQLLQLRRSYVCSQGICRYIARIDFPTNRGADWAPQRTPSSLNCPTPLTLPFTTGDSICPITSAE